MNGIVNFRRRRPSTRLHQLIIILAVLAVVTLATAPVNAQQTVVDICGRTPEVQTAILAKVSGATCSTITQEQLNGIEQLDITGYSISSIVPGEFAGLTELKFLNLKANAIETLHPGAFDGLTSLEDLHLSQNRIKTLEEGVFRGLTSVTGLYVTQNRLTVINPGAFNDLTALETLHIYTNNITTLDANTFSGLTTLKSIDLSNNPIDNIHVDTFDPLPSLESLIFGNLNLADTDWHEDLFESLTNLMSLWIYSNGITALDVDIFDGLTNLKTLDISKNEITALPEGIFDGLSSLQTLYLYSNELSSLPADVFDELTSSLTRLWLHRNKITSLHEDVFDGLSGVTQLPLSFNELTTLPEGLFDETTALQTLPLNNNMIASLPENTFDGLTALTTLYLNDNRLSSLNVNLFDETTALRTLFLHRNTLSSLDADTFDGLTDLQTLILYNNNLSSLDADIFDGLTSLQTLVLNGNGLSTPDADIFDGLTNLRTLYFNDNGLSSPDADLFDGLTNLSTLYLNDNGLSSLDADLFDGLANLSTLYLNDNGLTALPATLFEDLDNSLQQLVLTDNSISTLPAMIFAGLTGLKGLDLSCNGLTALDLSRFDPFASSLTYLDITGNSFTTPPTDAAVRAKLTSIANLYISEANADCLLPDSRDLSSLTVSAGTMDPVFEAPGASGYSVTVADDVTSIVITPTTTDPHAKVTSIPPDTDTNSPGIQVNLPIDRTRVDFTVTAENGVTTRTFFMEVFRDHPPATNARLSGLTLSDVTFAEEFDSRTHAYTATSSLATTTVIPELSDPDATVVIKLDGTEDSDGTVDLATGTNVITVEVTAEDGTTKKTYTVTVTREAQGKVLLSTKLLSLAEGNEGNYSVVLDRQPAANVTVTIGGHAGTNVTPNPTSLTFTTTNWSRSQQVFVSTTADTNTTNESFPLTHTATSSDSLFDGITIPSVIVNVDDQDAPDHHIRTITVPYGLPLGETALPEEEFEVWIGPPFEETIEGVTQGHRWSPSGLWGDPDADIIWVVDPIHFGIHALKLSALKQGRVERHIAADTAEFDHRFNYRCHFSESRASGYGNPSLTVMWGSPTRVLIANESSGTLDAYDRDSSITNQCYTRNVTSWAADGQSYTTADENFKSPFGFVREFDLPLGPLTVRGIWANSTQVWLSGPTAGVYTLALGGSRRMNIAPGYDGHTGSSNGLWSDGTTMWVAADSGWLRAYNLNSGSRRAEFDIRIQTYGMPPGDIWSDGETIWVTNRMGKIDAYRLPDRPYARSVPETSRAIVADPLTASFASAPEAHDGENGFNVRIVFSDDVEITPEDMRDHALLVSGGTVTDAARVKGRSDLWELTVEPAGPGPVSILAPLGRACTDQGALCTADGRSLTAGPALQVPGPPADGPPDAPDQPEGTAVFVGGVDLEWNDVPGAESYDLQQYRGGQWTGLPADGVEIAFYGAGAIISGLDPEASLWFRVRAANAHGVSDWSALLYMNSTSQFKLGRQARPDNEPASGAPVVHGTAQVGESLWADATGIEDGNGLDRVQFQFQWTSNDGSADTDIAGATNSGYTLVADDVGRTIRARVAFTDRGGYSETRTSAATDAVAAAPQPDRPATGQPTITGTARVGETLTADTTGITDADGLVNATYSYQWVANDGTTDTDISGETDATYTLVAADEGQTIKVEVSFTDDAGNDETLSSGATDVVAAAEPPAKPTGLSAVVSHDTVTLTWDNPQDDSITGYVILRRDREIHPVGTFITITGDTGSADTTYTDDTVEPDKQYVYRIKAINEHGEVSEISNWVRGFTPAAPAPAGSPAK